MARWIKDPRYGFDETAADIAAVYQAIERSLIATARTQTRAGLPAATQTTARAAILTQLRTEAAQAVNWLNQATPKMVDRVLTIANQQGVLAGLAAARPTPVHTTPPTRRPPTAYHVEALTADLTNKLDNVHLHILRWPDDFYRRVVGTTAHIGMIDGANPRLAQPTAYTQLLAQGITGFTDKTGRE